MAGESGEPPHCGCVMGRGPSDDQGMVEHRRTSVIQG